MTDVEPLTDRDKEMLDPRVGPALHKEKLGTKEAIRERVKEADKRRNGGNR